MNLNLRVIRIHSISRRCRLRGARMSPLRCVCQSTSQSALEAEARGQPFESMTFAAAALFLQSPARPLRMTPTMPAEILFGPQPRRSVTLNRPAALNALSFAMIQALAANCALGRRPASSCGADPRAGDKAFCAGGDIRALLRQLQAGQPGMSCSLPKNTSSTFHSSLPQALSRAARWRGDGRRHGDFPGRDVSRHQRTRSPCRKWPSVCSRCRRQLFFSRLPGALGSISA